jgi:hypothetical protein
MINIEAIKKRAEAAKEVPFYTWVKHAKLIESDVPKLLAEIEVLRGNLKTIEALSTCADTKDFAKRALDGEANIRI